MDNSEHLKNELAFLVDQSDRVKARIESADDGLSTCGDNLEEHTLKAMREASQRELAWLDELITRLTHLDPSFSLESLIMHEISETRRTYESLMGGWRRGRPTPSGYWEAKQRLDLLTELLVNYHAWMDAAPTEEVAAEPAASADDEPAANNHLGPWYPNEPAKTNGDNGTEISRPLNGASPNPLIVIEDAIYAALDHVGCPEGYIEVVVESPEMVMVRGSARSSDERDAILAAVMTVEAVNEVLADIRVLPPGKEPDTLFDRHQRDHARNGTHGTNGVNGT